MTIEILQRRLEREINARKQAEAILEQKALDLYKVNEQLRHLNDELELRVQERTLELQRSEDKYRGIIENMDLGILEVDNQERIVRAYSRFAYLTGYDPEELIGKNALDVFLPMEQRIIMDEQRAKRMEGEPGAYEVQMRRKDGSMIWVIISGAPVMDMKGNVVGSIGVHLDITRRKMLEEELSIAKQRAEEAQLAEKQFLANMSHEIRTPLNAIIGMAHLLYDTRPTPQQVDFLNALKSSADLLHSLISDILDFSKIETGNIEIRENPFDLIGLLRTIQKTFQLKINDKPVKVEAFIDAAINSTVIGDEMLLNQVLINLVGNAEKFTEKGKIGIKASVMDEEIGFQTIEFEVYDTGIGMDENQLPLIFQNFKQLDNEKKQKHKGTGLGLAITKRLIELQGGNIEVESRKGKGTTFTFSITYKVSSDNPTVSFSSTLHNSFESEPINSHDMEGYHVLLAEDNLMNQMYLINLLMKWKVSYVIANNGREAINYANKEPFDLIFMDIQMPIVDGYEATLNIRNTHNLNQNTPIVALTASAILDEKNKAFQVGMSDYISKPFGPAQIQAAFKKFLLPIKSLNGNTTEDSKLFTFNSHLDTDYLDRFYEGDFHHAAEMFDIFINQSIPDFYSIENCLVQNHFVETKQKVHKLKPVFAMVGLTSIGKKIEELENLLLQKCDNETTLNFYHQISKDINLFLPILKEDLKMMRVLTN